jgi:hypothetical protein
MDLQHDRRFLSGKLVLKDRLAGFEKSIETRFGKALAPVWPIAFKQSTSHRPIIPRHFGMSIDNLSLMPVSAEEDAGAAI